LARGVDQVLSRAALSSHVRQSQRHLTIQRVRSSVSIAVYTELERQIEVAVAYLLCLDLVQTKLRRHCVVEPGGLINSDEVSASHLSVSLPRPLDQKVRIVRAAQAAGH